VAAFGASANEFKLKLAQANQAHLFESLQSCVWKDLLLPCVVKMWDEDSTMDVRPQGSILWAKVQENSDLSLECALCVKKQLGR